MVTDICTPRRCDSTGPTGQSPIRGNIVFDDEFSFLRSELLLIKTEQNEQRSELGSKIHALQK